MVLFLVLSWLGAFAPVLQHVNPDQLPWRLGSAPFFMAFLAPLFRARPAMLFVTARSVGIFRYFLMADQYDCNEPVHFAGLFHPGGKSRIGSHSFIACIGLVLAGAMVPGLFGYPEFPWFFLVLYSVMLAMGLALFRTVFSRNEESRVRYETRQ